MNSAPWFKLHAAEFLGSRDTRFLTAEQRGLYIQLLAEAWQSTPKATLPADLDLVWRLAGAESRERFDQVSGPVLALFKRDGDYLFSPMLSEQVAAMAQLIPKRSSAGKKGAQSRWQKQTDGKSMASATDLPDRRDVDVDEKRKEEIRTSQRELIADAKDLIGQKPMPLSDHEWAEKKQVSQQKAQVAMRLYGTTSQ